MLKHFSTHAFVPNGMPLSSESVALGKILYYFNNSFVYKYSSSSTTPLQNDTEVAEFLYNIALKTGTTFNTSYSFATFPNMLSALTNFGFSYNSGTFTQQNLMNSIDNESPTLITEYDNNQRSLTWVCDGYRIIYVRYDYFLMAPVGQLEDPFGPYEPAAQWENKSNPNFQIRESSAGEKFFNAFFSPDDPYGNAPKKETNVVYRIEDNTNK